MTDLVWGWEKPLAHREINRAANGTLDCGRRIDDGVARELMGNNLERGVAAMEPPATSAVNKYVRSHVHD